MGLFLVILVAAVFVIGGALVLLVSLWRRTEQHRGALLLAYGRIEQLEQTISALTFGLSEEEFARLPVAPQPVALPREAPPAALPEPGLAILTTAPTLDLTPEPAPLSEPVPAAAYADAVKAAAPVGPGRTAETTLDPEVAEPEPAAQPAMGRGAADLPRPDIVAATCGLIALAALATARTGLFAPLGGAAIAAQAGAVCIALAVWRGRFAPAPLLALFGLALVGSATLAARYLSPDMPTWLAGAALAALALGSLYLARAHGPLLAIFAIGVGLAAPLVAPLDATTMWTRPAGLLGLAAMGAAVAGRWAPRPVVWVAFVGAIAWAAVAASLIEQPMQAAAAASYAGLLGLLGLAYAWPGAHAPIDLPAIRNFVLREAPTAGLSLYAGAVGVLTLLAFGPPPSMPAPEPALAVLILLVTLGGIVSAYRAGLALAPLLAASVSALAIALWPAAGDAREAIAAAGALAGACVLGGAIMLLLRVSAGGLLAAFGPIAAIVAAQTRAAELAPPWVWALSATALAALAFLAFLQFRRSAVFLTAAVTALATAGGFVTPAPWPPLVVALALPLLAWADTRLNQPGLRASITLLAFCLAPLLAVLAVSDAPAPSRAIIAVIAVLSAFAAARSLNAGMPTWISAQATFVATLTIAATALSLEAYRAAAPSAPSYALHALGAAVGAWMLVALVMAHRFGTQVRRLIAWPQTAAVSAIALVALIGGGVLFNPWWGVLPAPAFGAPLLNALALAYLGPAMLFGLYAWLRDRQGLKLRAAFALCVALTLAFLHLTLELRRAFHGAEMAIGPIYPAEGWAYALGWFGFAAGVLLLAIERGAAWLRYVSLGIALVALAKAAVFDLSAFGPLMQGMALAALVAAGVGVTLLYRRYVLPPAAAAPKTAPEATPPRSS